MSGGQLTGSDMAQDGHWDSAAKPIANDLAAVPPSNANNIIDSTSAASGIDLDMLKLGAGRTGKFGTSATPIATVADEMDIEGAGGVYIDCGAGALTTDFIKVQMDNPSVEVVLGSAGTSNWKDMDFNRGNITLSGSALFHASAVCRVGHVAGKNDVSLRIAAAAGALPRLDMASGTAHVSRELTLLNMIGETRVVIDTAKAVQCFVGPGSTLVYNHKATAGQTTKIVVFPGGFLDLLGNTEPKVLDDVHVKRGGRIRWLENSKMHTITTFRNENRN